MSLTVNIRANWLIYDDLYELFFKKYVDFSLKYTLLDRYVFESNKAILPLVPSIPCMLLRFISTILYSKLTKESLLTYNLNIVSFECAIKSLKLPVPLYSFNSQWCASCNLNSKSLKTMLKNSNDNYMTCLDLLRLFNFFVNFPKQPICVHVCRYINRQNKNACSIAFLSCHLI